MPNNECVLKSATAGSFDFNVKVYDDGYKFGYPLWIYGDEFGPTFIVAAQTFEDAYEIVMDESFTIEENEMYEAFGFDNEEDYQAALVHMGKGEYPDLQEGYTFQSNCTGTGIVHHGYHEWLRELDKEYIKTHEVKLRWER